MNSSVFQIYIDKWRLTPRSKRLETHSSCLYWCQQNDQNCVLKIYKAHSDEAAAAELLRHYGGKGAVKLLAADGHACLLEQVGDGKELVELVRDGRDIEALDIYCDVVQKLHAAPPVNIGLKHIDEFIVDFDAYLAKHKNVERELVEKARHIFAVLAASQGQKVNLHGDLHHYNILQANDGQWLAIDPKGYWGEAEYDLAAYLRNPILEKSALLATQLSKQAMNLRVEHMAMQLGYDLQRVRKWAFCQAILAAIWADGHEEFSPLMLKVAHIFNDKL
ncbi:MAG: fructosamine kinase family protein [Rhizobiales bacterium]|nr:fructosamine kinase family protein [Hyphomicrobiales bacterium]NRB15284.1 fructosamine kinase family protein [Hyphomicrobiales bacterium]